MAQLGTCGSRQEQPVIISAVSKNYSCKPSTRLYNGYSINVTSPVLKAYQHIQRAALPAPPEGGEAAGSDSWLVARGGGRSAARLQVPLGGGKRRDKQLLPPFPPVSGMLCRCMRFSQAPASMEGQH